MEVTDPVCGMTLDRDRAAATVERDGWLHFFCSDECHRLFEAQPDRFVGRTPKTKNSSADSERAKRDDHV